MLEMADLFDDPRAHRDEIENPAIDLVDAPAQAFERRLFSLGFRSGTRHRRKEWLTDRIRVFNAPPDQERGAHRGELALAVAPELGRLELYKPLEMAGDREAKIMRRLRNDLVDHAQFKQVRGRELERRRRRGDIFLVRLAPQYRGASFGCDHRVTGVLLHQHHVADPDGERAARSAFADDTRDDRDFEPRHQLEIAGDGFVLAAFLGSQPGVRALGVNERYDRQAEAIGKFENPGRLAIAFGFGGAEVATDALLGGLAALMADDCDRILAEIAEARDDRSVIGKPPVAMKLKELSKQRIDVIQRLRPHRIAREANPFDGAE